VIDDLFLCIFACQTREDTLHALQRRGIKPAQVWLRCPRCGFRFEAAADPWPDCQQVTLRNK